MRQVTYRRLAPRPGQWMHWAEAGEGTPLLLVHGGHGGLVHWSANLQELALDHRVLAPDLPGFGDSFDPGRCLLPEEQAVVLLEWLAALRIAPVRVVGFSFGSLVALAMAREEPARCAAVVLVNPPGVGPRSPQALALPERMSALARAQGRRAGIEGTLRELMLSRQELVTPDLVDRMTLAAERTRYVTRSISRSSPTLEQLPALRERRVPACVLIGERDPFHSNDLTGRRAGIDGVLGVGATRFVPGAAHWLQYDQPQAFAAQLRRFFGEIHNDQETT